MKLFFELIEKVQCKAALTITEAINVARVVNIKLSFID